VKIGSAVWAVPFLNNSSTPKVKKKYKRGVYLSLIHI